MVVRGSSRWMATRVRFEKAEVPKVVFSWYGRGPTNDPVAIATRWLSRSRSIVETVDGGLSWLILNSPSPYVWSLDVDQRESRLQQSLIGGTRPAHCFVGLFEVPPDTMVSSLVQETSDAGKTWHSANFPIGVAGDTANPVVHDIWVLKFDTTSKRLAAATDSGVYVADTVLDNAVASSSIQNNGEVYPNPSSNEIRIPVATPFLQARIIDAVGRELQVPSRLENGERVFDVSKLPDGPYSAQIENTIRTYVRFIVRH